MPQPVTSLAASVRPLIELQGLNAKPNTNSDLRFNIVDCIVEALDESPMQWYWSTMEG